MPKPLHPSALPLRLRQRGAAMTEFIIGALFFLLPLYLAVQAMGKFADAKHVAQSAARYAAWERTIWSNDTSSSFHAKNNLNQKSDAAIKAEIAVRVLNDRHATLKYRANDRQATSFASGIDPLWQDTAGQDYLARYEQYASSGATAAPSKDLLGSAVTLIGSVSIPHVTGNLLPPVPTNNLATAEITFSDLAKDSEVYRRLWSRAKGLPDDWVGVSVTAQAGVLTNGWGANASGGTRQMVSESVPTAKGLGTAVQVGAWATMAPWDPMLVPRLDLGRIGPDVVPSDRLK